MDIHTLRILFDSMCEQLESLEETSSFGFLSAYGLEFPEGVVMIFVFTFGALVFRFGVEGKPSWKLQSLQQDQLLDMVQTVDQADSFSELFAS